MAKPIPAKTPLPSSSLLAKLNDWHCIGILVVLVFIFFRKILLSETYLWEDFIYYYYPTKNFAAVSLAHGKLPLWNPYTFSGMPFLADIQNAVFYPFNLLLAIFTKDILHFIYVEYSIVLHFLLAGIGMFYLARNLKLERLPSLFAATAFVFSGFMVTHAIHQTIISGAAWLPLITLFVLKALRERNIMSGFLAAVTLTLSILAGFPQVSLYTFFFAGCLFLFELVTVVKSSSNKLTDVIRVSIFFALIIILSLSMAAVQLLPTMELAPLSNRAAITYEQSLVGSLTWSQLLTLVVPKFFGVSNAEAYNYWGSETYWHYWETCIYIGLPTLVLVILSMRYLKQNAFWMFLAGVGIFSLLAGLGDSFVIHKVLFNYVPGFDKFRNPGRFTMLFAFIMPLLAGVGLHHLLFNKDFFSNRRKVFLYSGVVSTSVIALFLGLHGKLLHGSFQFLQSPQIEQFVSSEISTALIISLLAFVLIVGVSRGWVSHSIAGSGFLILCFIDLYMFGFAQNNGRTNPLEYFRRGEPLIQNLLAEGKNELFRVNSRQGGYMIFDRNQGMMHNIFLLEGYTPLGLARVWPPATTVEQQFDMLNVKYAISVDEQRQSMGLRLRAGYMPRAYVVYSARIFPLQSDLEAFMKSSEFDYRHMVALEKTPAVSIPESTTQRFTPVQILSYESDKIVMKVAVEYTGILVLSEIFYPGWIATVDDVERAILQANGTLRVIALEPGNHTVVFQFKPTSFRNGMWISIVSVALCVTIVYVSQRKKKETSAHKE